MNPPINLAAPAVVLACFLAAAGCATEPTTAPQAQQGKKQETEVVTGSRIPQKASGGQAVSTVSGQEWARDSKSNVSTGQNPN
jgi:hypothetical protein